MGSQGEGRTARHIGVQRDRLSIPSVRANGRVQTTTRKRGKGGGERASVEK